MDNVTSIVENKLKNLDQKQKIFGKGMYEFLMFMIEHYRRVKTDLKMDFDSFIIMQVVVSHEVYIMQSETAKTYSEISNEFDKISKATDIDATLLIFKAKELMSKIQRNKLTPASICQVTTLPKETVRRKIRALVQKNILTQTKSEGILVGPGYKTIFDSTAPKTIQALSKLTKKWKETGVLDSLLKL